MPHYQFSPDTGLWDHRGWQHNARMRLDDVTYREGRLEFPHNHQTSGETAFAKYLEEAERAAATTAWDDQPGASYDKSCVTEDFEDLRWFALPHEAAFELSK